MNMDEVIKYLLGVLIVAGIGYLGILLRQGLLDFKKSQPDVYAEVMKIAPLLVLSGEQKRKIGELYASNVQPYVEAKVREYLKGKGISDDKITEYEGFIGDVVLAEVNKLPKFILGDGVDGK